MVDRSWELSLISKRPNYDELFMLITVILSLRVTCLRRRLGAVLVKDGHIIATGYNGPAKGIPHCNPCKRDELGVSSGTYGQLADCVSVHAEVNCINQLARYSGPTAEGSTMYVMNTPCLNCMKSLVNAGIKKIIYLKKYDDPETELVARAAGVQLIQYQGRPIKTFLNNLQDMHKDIFQEKEICIGLTSLARAGKDTFASRLINEFDFKQLNMSDVLKEELIKQGREPTKMNMSIIGDELRNTFGRDIVMKKTLEKAKNIKRLVITGIRSTEEVSYLKQNLPHFKLVSLISSSEKRFERRNEEDAQTFEEFLQRDKRDIENKGLNNVIQMSDYKLENNGSVAEFQQKIDVFVKPLL